MTSIPEDRHRISALAIVRITINTIPAPTTAIAPITDTAPATVTDRAAITGPLPITAIGRITVTGPAREAYTVLLPDMATGPR